MEMLITWLPFIVYVTVFFGLAVGLIAIVHEAVTYDESTYGQVLPAAPTAPAEQASRTMDRAA